MTDPRKIEAFSASRARLMSVGKAMVNDMTAGTVCARLDMQGVRSILLKGPTIATWLYEPGERPYEDVDIIVDPSRRPEAERVLIDLGFKSAPWPLHELERPVNLPWAKASGEVVDLHVSLPFLEHFRPQAIFEELFAASEERSIGGWNVRVLREPARLFHVALHALAHGSLERKPQEDLSRALEQIPRQTWEEAANFARRLDIEVFSEGLRMDPQGRLLADELGLPSTPSFRTRLGRSLTESSAESIWFALGLQWLQGLTWRQRLSLGVRKVFPAPDYLRARSKVATRGVTGLILAYAMRPLRLIRLAIPGVWAYVKNRKALPGE